MFKRGVRGRCKTITYDTRFGEFGDFAKFGYSKGQRGDGGVSAPKISLDTKFVEFGDFAKFGSLSEGGEVLH